MTFPVLSSTFPVDDRAKLSRLLVPICTKHVDDRPGNVIHPMCMEYFLGFLTTFHSIELEINTVVKFAINTAILTLQ